ncbi:ATP-binding protein [Mycobacterium sp. CVI_P3]|uniref:sensor histidine kinase n=1 Tax=Mycobacterium pinniadriaticum TaxID=2994102 RepID=UPI00224951BA|nr:ATP-binding protein [Mycobacterium pinniadriaticum]MCX2934946.1 ATP-binding protein [Mycobacterium pinniadriaticum]
MEQGSLVGDVSQQQLLNRAADIGLLTRHAATLVVVVVGLFLPGPPLAGRVLLTVVGGWSLYRLLTRKHGPLLLFVDFACVLAVCVGLPLIAPHPDFYTHNSVPAAITGTAVVTFGVSLPVRLSLPMTVVIALSFGAGAAGVVGWAMLPAVPALYYFFLQWGNATLMRTLVLRVAAAVDRSRQDRVAAEVDHEVARAVRDAEREHLALLHDTAASTLLMVDQARVAPQRLAAQARRDLEVLAHRPWEPTHGRLDVVAALRRAAVHIDTPTSFRGREDLWLDAGTATAVIAAAREAMTNVDRHARATCLTIAVGLQRVTLTDDGVGFAPDRTYCGHGVADSITARMQRAGGSATVASTPGCGTTVELTLPTAANAGDDEAADTSGDPERLAERIHVVFGLGLIVLALAVLASTIPYGLTHSDPAAPQVLLAALAAIAPLAAIPGILAGRWGFAWPATLVVAAVTIVQPILLPTSELGGQAHWAQGAIGWCLIPLLLALPTRRASMILLGFWLLAAIVSLARLPSWALLANFGLGTASLFGVQLVALLFTGLVRSAAIDIHDEVRARQEILTTENSAAAIRAEYHTSQLDHIRAVTPLLTTLAAGDPITETVRLQARIQSQRLRALFDQEKMLDHVLVKGLRPGLDAAELTQTAVEMHVHGELPDLDDDAVSYLVRPVNQLLHSRLLSARIVISTSGDELTLSVVAHHGIGAAVVPHLDRMGRLGPRHM